MHFQAVVTFKCRRLIVAIIEIVKVTHETFLTNTENDCSISQISYFTYERYLSSEQQSL